MDSDIITSYNGTRVLVLGASGFIGRWVAAGLARAGADLYLAVRNAGAMQGAGIPGTVLQADLTDPAAVTGLVTEAAPAVIFNLACYGVDPRERDEAKAWQINAELLQVLAQVAARIPEDRWQGQRIVHTGSALEYGESSGDLAEETIPAPTTLYGKTKLAGTMALQREAEATGLACMTARLFTVYGPGERRGRLLPSLLDAARKGGHIDLTKGEQQRDFTYVEDVVEGLLRLGISNATPGEAVNLATGRLTSVRQFIETAARIMGIPAEHLHFGALPTRAEEMQHEPVTVRRLQALTSWVPSVSVAQGIEKTCQKTAEHDGGIAYG